MEESTLGRNIDIHLADRVQALEVQKVEEMKRNREYLFNFREKKDFMDEYFFISICMLIIVAQFIFQEIAWVLVKQISGNSYWKFMLHLVSACFVM